MSTSWTRLGVGTLRVSTVALALIAYAGCSTEDNDQVAKGPVVPGGEVKKKGGGGPGGGGPSNPKIKAIMVKLSKGKTSLTPVIGQELDSETPDWTTIQPQTREYHALTIDMAKEEPAKGSKDSWAKLSGDYAALAADLEKAAEAKNRDAAKDVHGKISASCKACHDQHRGGGPGGGGGPAIVSDGAGGMILKSTTPGGGDLNIPSDYPGMEKKTAPEAAAKPAPDAAKPAPDAAPKTTVPMPK